MKIIFAAFLVLTVISCAPRGESKSVDEVLAIQRSKFTEQRDGANLSGPVKQELDSVAAGLETLSQLKKGEAVEPLAVKVSEGLTVLISDAGYTSRPALSELISQYRVLSADQASENGGAAVKLLVARTYSALASELETTKFQL